MQQIAFLDLETGPSPVEQLENLKPEFKADSRLKDPDKIKASIMEKEQAWKDELALSAVTGRVLCFGYMVNGEFSTIFGDENEKLVLVDALGWMAQSIRAGYDLVGFYSRSFDVPFLMRRAWKLGVQVPLCFYDGRYINSQFVDVAERWACGGREPRDRISLDTLSKFLGTGAKNGDGADFAKLWSEDRPKALEYLKQDLNLTRLAYERLFA